MELLYISISVKWKRYTTAILIVFVINFIFYDWYVSIYILLFSEIILLYILSLLFFKLP